jgi:hypothetical protein
MHILQCTCAILMFSTRRIDWAYLSINLSWSAKVRKGSALEVDLNIKSSANNASTQVPLNSPEELEEVNWLSPPRNQWQLNCTLVNSKTVCSWEAGWDKASCTELVWCDGLGDGDDARESRSKYIKASGVEMVFRVMGMVMVMAMVITLQIQFKQMKYGCRDSRRVRLISKCKISNLQSAVGFHKWSIAIGHSNYKI